MRNQIVQWIFLPGGMTEGGFLAASVFIAPRLRSDEGGTLADFPDFVDWPDIVRPHEVELLIQRDDGATIAPESGFLAGDSDLWAALFPPETPVRSFDFDDYADRPLVSYPLRRVLDYLQVQWAGLARDSRDDLPVSSNNASPIGPPLDPSEFESQTLSSIFEELRRANRLGVFEGAPGEREVSARMAAALRNAAQNAAQLRAQHHTTPQPLIQPFAQGNSPADHFYQLAMFHRRPQQPPAEFPPDAEAARAELDEKLEFHRLLSTLPYHPFLLRQLGLAFDFDINPDFLPVLGEQDPPSHLRVVIRRRSHFPARSGSSASPWNLDVTPWTQCRLVLGHDGASFSAAERPGSRDYVHGMVHLDPARYVVAGVDVDGLALKALNMASTLEVQEQQSQRPVEEDARAGTPALRTGGLTLALTERAQGLHDDFYLARQANDALETDPANPPVLFAEQLVRGYRMDIFDGFRAEWLSLHDRHTTYTPVRNPDLAFEVEDEGFVEISLTGELDRPDAPADPDSALYAHEALVTWDGWSLSAPRPGRAIQQEPAPPEASPEAGALQLDMVVSALPRTLPRLRFGVDYRLRLRAVDLSGRSLTMGRANYTAGHLDYVEEPGFRVSLPGGGFVYRRGEPVPPPELVPRALFSPGEGLERLVIRSNPPVPAELYAAAHQGAEDETLRYRPYCDRHIAAAKGSLQLIEAHGLLDAAIDAVHAQPGDAAAAVAQFYQIAARENGSFRDDPATRFIQTGEHQGEPQGYVTIDADEVALPYLPDPFSNGAVIRLQFSPVEPEQRFDIDFAFATDWHDPLPIRLRLEEGAPDARYDTAQRLFTVSLPAGRVARMRLNSLFLNDPDLFEIMAWCRQRLAASDADRVFEAIGESRHWMTTPWRTLQLVHAVQQPLQEPQFELAGTEDGAFRRWRGETAAALAGTVWLDGASTATLDMTAEWVDVVDDPALGLLDVENMEQPVRANAFKIVLPEPFASPWAPEIEQLLQATDTDGGQEWRELRFSTVDGEMRSPQDVRRDLLDSAAGPSLTTQERNRLAGAAAQLDGLRQHEFGDTKYRRVTYQMVAATRFREYFDPAMPVEDGVVKGNIVTVDMLSSAPPAAPVVLDVVPIVRWERSGAPGGGQLESRRHSAGLRVWLARPWFSSGAGEMLGLVCGLGGPMAPASELYREISVISQDPAHASALPMPLRAASFPGADRIASNVPLQVGSLRRDVAAFHPRYDPGRDAWYCDIEFETGEAYFPFVRLGLVRFQPKSLENCLVSAIVPTAFLQPLPDRTLTVIPQGADAVSVRLRGPAPQARHGIDDMTLLDTNAVVATVEVQEPGIEDAVLGWVLAGEEVRLEPVEQGALLVEWAGTVTLPADAARHLRLAVREYELHPTDDRSGAAPVLVEGRRLVHADVVPLG